MIYLILFFSFSSNYNRDKVNDYLWYSVRDRGNLSIYILKLSTQSNIQGKKKPHQNLVKTTKLAKMFIGWSCTKFAFNFDNKNPL
jgi:hypothetical protein